MSFLNFVRNAASGLGRVFGKAGSVGRQFGSALGEASRNFGTAAPGIADGIRSLGSLFPGTGQSIANTVARGVEMAPGVLQRAGYELGRAGDSLGQASGRVADYAR